MIIKLDREDLYEAITDWYQKKVKNAPKSFDDKEDRNYNLEINGRQVSEIDDLDETSTYIKIESLVDE